MDGDFDVSQRSADGCIPPLLAMARLSGSDAERDVALVEQEVHKYTSSGSLIASELKGVLPFRRNRLRALF